MGSLSKGVCPHQCEWALSNPFKAWIDKKIEEGWICYLLLLGYPSSLLLDMSPPGSQAFRLWPGLTTLVPQFLGFCTWIGIRLAPTVPQVLRPLNLDCIIPLALLVLWLAGGKLWDFLASIIVWINFYNISPLVLFLWRTLMNTLSKLTSCHSLPTPILQPSISTQIFSLTNLEHLEHFCNSVGVLCSLHIQAPAYPAPFRSPPDSPGGSLFPL